MEKHGGRELDGNGHFLLLFDRPLAAIELALDYQRALAEQGGAAEIGIHLGEVPPRSPLCLEEGPGWVARQIAALADRGQTLLTRTAFDVARQSAASKPADGLIRWLAHGNYLLEGQREPVEIFEVGEKDVAPLQASTQAATRSPYFASTRTSA